MNPDANTSDDGPGPALPASAHAVSFELGLAEPAPAAPRRSWRRIGVGAGFTLIVFAGAAALIGAALAQEPPSWWRVIDAKDPALAAKAQLIENGAATQLTKIRAAGDGQALGPPWTIALKAEDANAWLATRLGRWLESQGDAKVRWPKELGQVQVAFDDGMVTLAASVHAGGAKSGSQAQVLSASLRPELRPDGSLWMPAQSVGLGRLALPAAWMLSPAGDAKMNVAEVPESIRELPQTKDLLKVMTGEIAAMRTATVKIGDGRRVRLLKLESRGGVLLITCQTLPRETSRAAGTPAPTNQR